MHIMGRDGVYSVETSKVGSLSKFMYVSLCTPDDGRGERPKHVE